MSGAGATRHGPKKSRSEIKLQEVIYNTDNAFKDGTAQAIFDRRKAPQEIKDLTVGSLGEIPQAAAMANYDRARRELDRVKQ